MIYFEVLPNWIKNTCDAAAVSTAFGLGIAAFFGAIATPLAALASLAALVYTVMRIVQIHRELKKGK